MLIAFQVVSRNSASPQSGRSCSLWRNDVCAGQRYLFMRNSMTLLALVPNCRQNGGGNDFHSHRIVHRHAVADCVRHCQQLACTRASRVRDNRVSSVVMASHGEIKRTRSGDGEATVPLLSPVLLLRHTSQRPYLQLPSHIRACLRLQ
jgi:hypothetical protein